MNDLKIKYYNYIKNVVKYLRKNYNLDIKTINMILDSTNIYTKGPNLLLNNPVENTSKELYLYYRKKILKLKNYLKKIVNYYY